MSSLLHPIRTIFGVFLDALTFIKLCFMPTTVVAAENLFLVNSSDFLSSGKRNLAGRPMRSALRWLHCLVCRQAGPLCNMVFSRSGDIRHLHKSQKSVRVDAWRLFVLLSHVTAAQFRRRGQTPKVQCFSGPWRVCNET